jgi:acetyltransferase-like isoleucine patch superfamily enzyme
VKHSSITKNHHIDCTNLIQIGDFVTVAGYSSQLLTHSINIELNIQDSNPIMIGDYCFVGTSSTILGGSVLPGYSVLGANSLLNKPFVNPYRLYGGNPAKEIKALGHDFKYFTRESGFVY